MLLLRRRDSVSANLAKERESLGKPGFDSKGKHTDDSSDWDDVLDWMLPIPPLVNPCFIDPSLCPETPQACETGGSVR